MVWLLAMHAQWAAETDTWLFPALAGIDEALAADDADELLGAAPDTGTAEALTALPSGFGKRLALDMTLDVGRSYRALIASLPDDGDIYVIVLCQLDGGSCVLRRFVLLSLSG